MSCHDHSMVTYPLIFTHPSGNAVRGVHGLGQSGPTCSICFEPGLNILFGPNLNEVIESLKSERTFPEQVVLV